MTKIEIEAAISHPDYSHTRAGHGCWREVRWIYHRDPSSPTGVRLAVGGDASIVEPLLRSIRHNSPLSSTER